LLAATSPVFVRPGRPANDSFGQKQEFSHDAKLMPRLLPLFLAAFYLAGATITRSAEAATATTLLTAADLFQLKQVESPALSPDGRWVIYVVRSIEPKPDLPAEASAKAGARDDWIYRTQLWLAAVDGKTPPRQLTFGSAGNSSPVWSPQGGRLAFVRSVEKEKPQIYLLSLAGGEAMPLTKLDTGAGSPRWSPDGTKILFTSQLSYAQMRDALEEVSKESAPKWSLEKPGRKANDVGNWGLKPGGKDGEKGPKKSGTNPDPSAKADGTLQEIREWLAKNEAEGNPRVMDRLNFLAEGDLEVEPGFNQFYIVEAREGAKAEAVTIGYEGYTGAEWLGDGQSLVCVGPRRLDEHPDRNRLTSLYCIDLRTGAARVLLEEAGCNYAGPVPSPDGKWIAYTVTTGGEYTFDQAMVAVMPAGGGKPDILTPQLDRAATNLKWSPDSTSVYFIAADRGRFPLYRVALAQREVQTLTAQPDWGIRDFDIGSRALVEVVTHPGNPWELYQGAIDGKAAQPLTTHNDSWLKDRKLSSYEPHRLVNKDGVTVDYWTLKPAGFDPAKKYPLLVNIHGGPAAMWGPGEATTWFEMQFYAARGYAIVFCNPRGSGGYGKDFQRANFRDWGTGPASDVLSAAGFTAREPYVDHTRQVLTGGSYGGYLTAWIVGHDHRFKAAVAQRGVYDLSTFFGEGNAWFLLPLYWGGYPWQKEVRHVLDRDSPLTYVENITTPLLIKLGDADYRVGVVQSQMLYKSLKQLGREVEYVRYPGATHELSRSGGPKQRLDRLVRFDEFFRRYIGDN
jgi:dipeptidyl aminopeptidase/acylaminoacyl peptidase